MTPTRHIENLLGIYGETLDDLPTAGPKSYAYDWIQKQEAKNRAFQFAGTKKKIDYQADFICHQSDVIEKLVTALEKAQREIKVVHCAECKHRPEFKSFTDEYGHTFTNYISPDGLCPLVCDDDWYSVVRDDDWFCGDGEPMEEQNEQKEE